MARIDRLLLTFLGVLIAHEAAYLTSSIAGYENSITHGHVKTAWLIGTVALLGVLTRSVLTSLRRRHHQTGNPFLLASMIGGGYFVVEQAERLADGSSALTLFSEPVFWLGVAVAPLVAVLLTRSLQSFEAAAARLIGTVDKAVQPTEALCTLAATALPSISATFLSSSVLRRGPPVGLSFR